MSVEKAIQKARELKNKQFGFHDLTFDAVIEILEALRDLDEQKECHHEWFIKDVNSCWCLKCGVKNDYYAEGKPVDHTPSGYWFINTFWKPTFQSLELAGEHIIEEYRKRKSVGNCFATEEEARQKLSKMKG